MGASTSEVGYTSATTGRGDHKVYKGHVVALGGYSSSYICLGDGSLVDPFRSRVSRNLFKEDYIIYCTVVYIEY
jgi:hypothetical protein